ncbi:hypothetical protein ACJJTC_018905 [Scirpophaga incertulas]
MRFVTSHAASLSERGYRLTSAKQTVMSALSYGGLQRKHQLKIIDCCKGNDASANSGASPSPAVSGRASSRRRGRVCYHSPQLRRQPVAGGERPRQQPPPRPCVLPLTAAPAPARRRRSGASPSPAVSGRASSRRRGRVCYHSPQLRRQPVAGGERPRQQPPPRPCVLPLTAAPAPARRRRSGASPSPAVSGRASSRRRGRVCYHSPQLRRQPVAGGERPRQQPPPRPCVLPLTAAPAPARRRRSGASPSPAVSGRASSRRRGRVCYHSPQLRRQPVAGGERPRQQPPPRPCVLPLTAAPAPARRRRAGASPSPAVSGRASSRRRGRVCYHSPQLRRQPVAGGERPRQQPPPRPCVLPLTAAPAPARRRR